MTRRANLCIALIAALLLAGTPQAAATAAPATQAPRGAPTYEVNVAPGKHLNIRDDYDNGSVVGKLPRHARVTIACVAWDNQGRMWDRINGTEWTAGHAPRYVLDRYIHTGTNRPVAPTCREWEVRQWDKRAAARVPLIQQQANDRLRQQIDDRLDELDKEMADLQTEQNEAFWAFLEAAHHDIEVLEAEEALCKSVEGRFKVKEKLERNENVLQRLASNKLLRKVNRLDPIMKEIAVGLYCVLVTRNLKETKRLFDKYAPSKYHRRPLR
jgi:hypothetical protein